jgi:hypothetical protein
VIYSFYILFDTRYKLKIHPKAVDCTAYGEVKYPNKKTYRVLVMVKIQEAPPRVFMAI